MTSSLPLVKPIPFESLSKRPSAFLESRSGKNHSVTSPYLRILITSFRSWQGTGIHEEGIDIQSGRTVVKVDPGYFRPAEVEYACFQKTM